jgi:hypothetical protein
VPEGAGPVALRDGWSLQSNCKVEKPGEVISTPRFQPTGWYAVSVPTTVVAALVKHKVYPDPGFGMNLRSYPGMSYPIGTNFSNIAMQQDSPFMVPWWYRKEFVLPTGFKSFHRCAPADKGRHVGKMFVDLPHSPIRRDHLLEPFVTSLANLPHEVDR